MSDVDRKMSLGVIVGTRGFFNPDLARRGRQEVLARLKSLGVRTCVLPADATAHGAVETLEDAEKCARFFHEHRDEIDGVLVTLPNFGDEQAIACALARARLDVPVLVHGCDDELDKLDAPRRRDAFCGKLSVCNNLYQHGIPFTDTTYHTEALAGQEFANDVQFFASVCRVVSGLRRARIGAIGTRPEPFRTMRISEKLLQASGITVVAVDLSEIIAAAKALTDSDRAVKAAAKAMAAYGSWDDGIGADVRLRHAKLMCAVQRWIDDNGIHAFAMQCWTSLQLNYGCQACLTMSMLGERYIPGACETDVNGVLSMYALMLAGASPAALIDWNNNYADQRDKCVAQHCCNWPRSFFARPVQVTYPAVLSAALGRDKTFGAIQAKAAAGDMSYCRISNDDTHGRLRAYVGDGEFTDDPFEMPGGIAVVRIPNLQNLMKYMCRNGFEHHAGMARGHTAEVLTEAFGTYLKWDVYKHQ